MKLKHPSRSIDRSREDKAQKIPLCFFSFQCPRPLAPTAPPPWLLASSGRLVVVGFGGPGGLAYRGRRLFVSPQLSLPSTEEA
jgi:hypothetical protein